MTKQLNIGIVTTWFERGAAYVSRAYKDALSPKHSVYIYARGGEETGVGNPQWDTPDVTWGKRYPMPISHTYIDHADLMRWIREKQLDIVFFNEQSWWQSVAACKNLGVITGAYVDYYTQSTIPLFDAYDFLICNTQRHFSAFDWHPGAHRIQWGVDTKTFTPQPTDRAGSQLTFFHSAGMSPYRKGTDLAIRAFAEVADAADVKLLIHSQVDVAAAFPELSETISTLAQKKKLEIISETVGAPGLYHLGDVYVYPSRLDGIGLSLLEAMACGLPSIVPDNAPMNEFTSNECQTAKIKRYFCRPDGYYWPMCEVDIIDLSQKMMHYSHCKETMATAKRSVRAFIESHFDWTLRRSDMLKVFETAEIRPLADETREMIDKYDNRQFPMISRWPKGYSAAYRAYRALKASRRG